MILMCGKNSVNTVSVDKFFVWKFQVEIEF